MKAKANGDIYKAKYEGFYCEGCESFKDESELINKRCEFHSNKEIQEVVEENYFFALSKYQKFLENHFKEHPEFVWPESKRKEILSFIKSGLKDFSVSRQNVSWGIPVPDDPTHTIYVWFDALINYLTYGIEENCWPADVHVLGKDNQRFHAIYWPAILLSSGLKLPKTLFVHEYFTVNGQKMSKTIGNVIDPIELIEKHGADPLRYYFLAKFSPFQDGDFSEDKFKEVYNADLANGLGNLVARVARLCEKVKHQAKENKEELNKDVQEKLSEYKFNEAISFVWNKIAEIDKKINREEPWKLADEDLKKTLEVYVSDIQTIGTNLRPFLPETAEKILKQFSSKIKSAAPLFPRQN